MQTFGHVEVGELSPLEEEQACVRLLPRGLQSAVSILGALVEAWRGGPPHPQWLQPGEPCCVLRGWSGTQLRNAGRVRRERWLPIQSGRFLICVLSMSR